jgi:hypothetical protein
MLLSQSGRLHRRHWRKTQAGWRQARPHPWQHGTANENRRMACARLHVELKVSEFLKVGPAMLNVTQAVLKAVEFSRDLGNEYLPVDNPLVEEVEFDGDTNNWLVTLSFAPPQNHALDKILGDLGEFGKLSRAERLRNGPRTYRQFKIDQDKGEVTAMKSVKIG